MRLAQRARSQAARFGTRFITGWDVTGLAPAGNGRPHRVHTEGRRPARPLGGHRHRRITYRKLQIPAIEALTRRGVFYGSAMTAAREMEGLDVVVVGGGNSAGRGRAAPGPVRPPAA